MMTTNPTTNPDPEVPMFQFTAMLIGSDPEAAAARVLRTLAKVGEGFTVEAARVASTRHMMCEVLVTAPAGVDRNDAWVVLTSYGISPSEQLGSGWQQVAGV